MANIRRYVPITADGCQIHMKDCRLFWLQVGRVARCWIAMATFSDQINASISLRTSPSYTTKQEGETMEWRRSVNGKRTENIELPSGRQRLESTSPNWQRVNWLKKQVLTMSWRNRCSKSSIFPGWSSPLLPNKVENDFKHHFNNQWHKNKSESRLNSFLMVNFNCAFLFLLFENLNY